MNIKKNTIFLKLWILHPRILFLTYLRESNEVIVVSFDYVSV